MMKSNLIKILIFFLVSLPLVGCQLGQKPATDKEKNYQLAIFDVNKILTFEENNGRLKQLETIARNKELSYWKEGFVAADGDSFFAKTKEDSQYRSYVATIDGKTLKERFVPTKGHTIYTSATDGTYYYATAVFMDRIEFYKYDLTLNVVHSKSIKNAETINASNQFVVIGDDLYLLVSQVVGATGVEQTELWRMDKEFTIQEKIKLEEANPYLRMVNIGEKLYLTEAFNGKSAEGYIGGRQILVYDLANHSKEYIQLSTSYPLDIYHDPVHNNLLIAHEPSHLSGIYWTLYQLDSGKETVLTFPEIQQEDSRSSFFTMKNGRYYFLFANNLIEVDEHGQKVANHDLTPYQLKSPHALIIK